MICNLIEKCSLRIRPLAILEIDYIWYNFLQLRILLGARKHNAFSQLPDQIFIYFVFIVIIIRSNFVFSDKLSKVNFVLIRSVFITVPYFNSVTSFRIKSSKHIWEVSSSSIVPTMIVSLPKPQIACRGPSNPTSMNTGTISFLLRSNGILNNLQGKGKLQPS